MTRLSDFCLVCRKLRRYFERKIASASCKCVKVVGQQVRWWVAIFKPWVLLDEVLLEDTQCAFRIDPLPAATRPFSSLENADQVKCLFLRKRINRYSPRWTQSDHCDALDSHIRQFRFTGNANGFSTGSESFLNALGVPEN